MAASQEYSLDILETRIAQYSSYTTELEREIADLVYGYPAVATADFLGSRPNYFSRDPALIIGWEFSTAVLVLGDLPGAGLAKHPGAVLMIDPRADLSTPASQRDIDAAGAFFRSIGAPFSWHQTPPRLH